MKATKKEIQQANEILKYIITSFKINNINCYDAGIGILQISVNQIIELDE